MNIMRNLARGTAVLAAVGLSAMVAVQPASAGYASCTRYKSCYYTGSSGTGSKWEAPGPGWWIMDGTVWYKNISSYDNTTGGGSVDFYDESGTKIFSTSTGIYGSMFWEDDNKTTKLYIN